MATLIRPMKRLLVPIFALFWAAPAMAQPRPPLPMAVTTVEAPGAEGAAVRLERLVVVLDAEGLLASRQPTAPAKRLKACARNAGLESCVRARLRKRPTVRLPVNLAAVIYPGPAGRNRIACIGPGPNRPWIPAPTAWIDIDRAAAGDGHERGKLIDCLNAAAAERGF